MEREQKGWKGIMFDGEFSDPSINLYKEMVSHLNILELFAKYGVTDESLDILSEDTDYADYWIVEKILTKYRPKIVIHEVNQQPHHMCVTVPKPENVIFWDKSSFHGGSVCAFRCLAIANGYTMVYCESAGVNCFWLRNDILESHLHFNVALMQLILQPAYLYKKPGFVYSSTSNIWHQIKC